MADRLERRGEHHPLFRALSHFFVAVLVAKSLQAFQGRRPPGDARPDVACTRGLFQSFSRALSRALRHPPELLTLGISFAQGEFQPGSVQTPTSRFELNPVDMSSNPGCPSVRPCESVLSVPHLDHLSNDPLLLKNRVFRLHASSPLRPCFPSPPSPFCSEFSARPLHNGLHFPGRYPFLFFSPILLL